VSPPVGFLYSFTRAIATISLYWDRHPARERAIESSFQRLRQLLDADPKPQFSFLLSEVIYNGHSIRELQDWEWTKRLAEEGIQRFEVEASVTLEEFTESLEAIAARLGAGAGEPTSESNATRARAIRYGTVGFRGSTDLEQKVNAPEPGANTQYVFDQEAAAIKWIHDEVVAHAGVPMLEAEAVVRSLSVAMHGEGRVVAPLLQLKRFDQYTTTHAINVAVLTMALADALQYAPNDVRAFGTAGLLHDLGKVRVPKEILLKPGKLTDLERSVMNQHPVDGARIILESDKQLGLAATVAYEHHVMIDGGGYPHFHFPRSCHYASRLVHVCDVFDAFRTDRPYRAAWTTDAALDYIEQRAGTEFDPEIARAFAIMMRRVEVRPTPFEDLSAEPDRFAQAKSA